MSTFIELLDFYIEARTTYHAEEHYSPLSHADMDDAAAELQKFFEGSTKPPISPTDLAKST